jgi:uncharacterized tellurite resistance protein B-like protein
MPETAAIVEVSNEVVDVSEREAMVAALWTVVFADGLEHASEDELLHLIENSLGVDPAVSARLRDEASKKV